MGDADDRSLKTKIHDETVAGMKAGEKIRVGALRLLSAAITNREKELRHELTDDEVREVAAKEIKKRGESIEAFEAAGRTDLAEREHAERAVLQPYAPDLLSDEEVDALIEEAIATTGASDPKAMGRVMGAVMGKAKGKVDGTAVQARVRARLGG